MFEEFPKIARLSRNCTVTEKIDGTNAQVVVTDDLSSEPWIAKVVGADGLEYGIAAASRTQYVTPANDNHGWAAWVLAHANELVELGVGRHYGEWWGSGIQRGYGLVKGEKRFSLFNTARWADNRDVVKYPTPRPACCHVVPVLYEGEFSTEKVVEQVELLRTQGSMAAPGFMKPEGVIAWHDAARIYFKKTLEKDHEWKGKNG